MAKSAEGGRGSGPDPSNPDPAAETASAEAETASAGAGTGDGPDDAAEAAAAQGEAACAAAEQSLGTDALNTQTLQALELATSGLLDRQPKTARAMYAMALAQSSVQAAMAAATYLQSVSTITTSALAKGFSTGTGSEAAAAADETVASARKHYEAMLQLAMKTLADLPTDEETPAADSP